MFSDDTAKLTRMANDIIEELLDLDMEPKPESLWWTSTYRDVECGRGKNWGDCRSLRCLVWR